jgi:membrane-bound lytic murein transglycosylase A
VTRRLPAALVVGGSLVLAACALVRPRAQDALVSSRSPALEDDLDAASLRAAVEATLPTYERRGDVAAATAARRMLEIRETIADAAERQAAIAREFRVMRVRTPILLTAYYEAELEGRLAPDATFRFPLYARPADLVDVEPRALDPACDCPRLTGRLDGGRLRSYHTRGEIDAGALAGRQLEIAWAADPFALFVLHVQGSGLLRLADGTTIGARYAGTNGRPYTSLGRVMVKRGLLDEDHTSLEDIRNRLAALPEGERAALLAADERYTFFRLADAPPVGSLGVPLTPGRSIATDPRLVPPGALAYLVTPTTRRFVVSQDTGAAIVGARADLFLGAGKEAESRAGRTRERGALYVFVPR